VNAIVGLTREVCLAAGCRSKVRSFMQWAAANCAALPTASAGQYITSHCLPLLFCVHRNLLQFVKVYVVEKLLTHSLMETGHRGSNFGWVRLGRVKPLSLQVLFQNTQESGRVTGSKATRSGRVTVHKS